MGIMPRAMQLLLAAINGAGPIEARLGTGRYNPITNTVTPVEPTDTDLENPVIVGVPVTVTQNGNSILLYAVITAGSSPQNITEAGFFDNAGNPLGMMSFRPVILEPGVDFYLEWAI